MPEISFGITYGRRDAAKTPQVFIRNLLLEANPTNQVDGKTWLLRPGTEVFPNPKTGALRGVLQAESPFPRKLFVAMGTRLYLESVYGDDWAQIGTVSGTDIVIFASSPHIVLLSANGSAYRYDGTTYAKIIMPNSQDVSWVVYLAGYFLLGVAHSQHIYFMAANAFTPIMGQVTSSSAGNVLTFDSAALADMITSGLKIDTFAFNAGTGEISLTNTVTTITPGTGMPGDPGTVTLTSPVTILNGQTATFYKTGPDALDFFSAETHPGDTVRAMVLTDQLAIFCTSCTEFWQPSADPDLPFSRIVGQGYERGLASPQAVVALDNTLMFVGEDLRVYRVSSVPQGISTTSIEERLRVAAVAYGSARNPLILQAWALLMDGHAYMILSIDGQGTFAFDVSTQSWLQWQTGDGPYWSCQYGVTLNGFTVLAGNPRDNTVYRVRGGLSTDSGTGISWQLSAGIPVVGPSVRLDNVVLFVDAGWGGTLSQPLPVNLEISNDQGATFMGPFLGSAGELGEYEANPVWQMLGQIKQPQCVLRFSGVATDAFRISYARFNEYFSS